MRNAHPADSPPGISRARLPWLSDRAAAAAALLTRHPLWGFATLYAFWTLAIAVGASTARYLWRGRFEFYVSDRISSSLLTESVERFAARGDADIGGFMHATEAAVHVAAAKLVDGPAIVRDAYPYISSFSLQYDLVKWCTLGRPELVVPAIALTSILYAAAMALVVGALCHFATREFSIWSGVAVLVGFCLSPQFVGRSYNLYWMLFLDFLPLLLVLLSYPRLAARGRFPLLLSGTALLVTLKALTGYEYISNILAGPALAILYHELVAAGGWRSLPLGRVVGRAILTVMAGIAGLLAAIALHVDKAARFFGSTAKGLEAFLTPLSYSTLSSAGGIRGTATLGVASVARMAVRYASYLPQYIALGLIVAGLWLYLRRRASPAGEGRERALNAIIPVALVISCSWFAAFKHSYVHPHINYVIFFLYFVPFAAMGVGAMLRRRIATRG